MISQHLDKNNLHHAYLIEGARDEIVKEILEFVKSLGIETVRNADVSHISLDSFKIDDARNLKSFASERGFSTEDTAKKIFIISTNSFLLEAQNSLLKMFEEPIHNTIFFVVVPDVSSLLRTFVSRFYLISPKTVFGEELKEAEKFIALSIKNRIDFIRELLIAEKEEDEEGNEIVVLDSARSKALKFLNALEFTLHKNLMSRGTLDIKFSQHLFKVREYLRMPGSSTKTLMESIALTIPMLQ